MIARLACGGVVTTRGVDDFVDGDGEDHADLVSAGVPGAGGAEVFLGQFVAGQRAARTSDEFTVRKAIAA